MRAVIDTSVVIGYEILDRDMLPATTIAERAVRQDRLQRAQSQMSSLPFDTAAAIAYGMVYATVLADGRKSRGGRAIDLLIAATALSKKLPLYTRNPADFSSLQTIMEIVTI